MVGYFGRCGCQHANTSSHFFLPPKILFSHKSRYCKKKKKCNFHILSCSHNSVNCLALVLPTFKEVQTLALPPTLPPTVSPSLRFLVLIHSFELDGFQHPLKSQAPSDLVTAAPLMSIQQVLQKQLLNGGIYNGKQHENSLPIKPRRLYLWPIRGNSKS